MRFHGLAFPFVASPAKAILWEPAGGVNVKSVSASVAGKL
jgi:hypothetical protein